jgi:hypothetical protein
VDGVLIQATQLVNGVTLAQVPCDRVEYWHVELDSHDILLAEGLAAESYLDCGNRTAFNNGGAFLEAHPDFRPKYWNETCVPLLLEGPEVQHAKAPLLRRAQELGCLLTDDSDLHIIADGERVEPMALGDKRSAFVLPEACQNIELRCRTFILVHVDGASGDRRSLGICVNSLQIDGIEVNLEGDAAFAQGWHKLERYPDTTLRWSCDRFPVAARRRADGQGYSSAPCGYDLRRVSKIVGVWRQDAPRGRYAGKAILGVLRANTGLRRGPEGAYTGASLGDVASRNFPIAREEDIMFNVIGRMSRKGAVMVVIFRGAGLLPYASDVAGTIAKEHIAVSVSEGISPYAVEELPP